MPDRKFRGDGEDNAGDLGEFEYKKGFKNRGRGEYVKEGSTVNDKYQGAKMKDKPPACKVFTTHSLAD